jgi:hypothetical protein
MTWALFEAKPRLPESLQVTINGSFMRFRSYRASGNINVSRGVAREEEDTAAMRRLMAALDAQHAIAHNPLLADGAEKLDRAKAAFYLRIVHSYDFYGGRHFPTEHSMPMRLATFTIPRAPEEHRGNGSGGTGGGQHGGAGHGPHGSHQTGLALGTANLVAAGAGGALLLLGGGLSGSTGEVRWLARAEEHIARDLAEAEIIRLGGQTPQAAEAEWLEDHTAQRKAEVYSCTVCKKLFKSAGYVEKHLKNKHPEELATAMREATYFYNYLRHRHRPVFGITKPGSTSECGGEWEQGRHAGRK